MLIKKIKNFNRKISKFIGNMYSAHKNYSNYPYLYEYLYNNPKYSGSKRITQYGKSVFSQNGEDGIIKEIFNRIGTTNNYFVEFGVGDGLENNTAFLLLNNWKGLWIEGSKNFFSKIKKNLREPILKEQLKVKNSFITPENIETIFEEFDVPKSPDLMSIDIDSTDYWVWKAIKNYTPRVVVVEYNETYFPPTVWIQRKNKVTWGGGKLWSKFTSIP